MKFGRILTLRAVAEWREHYVGYKRLKRLLRKVPLPKESLGSGSFSPRASLTEDAFAAALEVPLLPPDYEEVLDEFFVALEEDLAKVNQLAAEETRAVGARVALAAGDSGSVLSEEELTTLYVRCAKLKSFLSLNALAVRKIVKKYDKQFVPQGGPSKSKLWAERLENEPFALDRKRVEGFVHDIERLVPPDKIHRLRDEASEALHPATPGTHEPGVLRIAISFALGITAALLPLETFAEPDRVPAQRCLGVLVTVIGLWLSEALPFFVTSLLAPILAIVSGAVPQIETGETQKDIAKRVLNSMFNSVILLVLSGLVAARVVARCQLELRVAAFLQRRLGNSPRLFILSVMLLGLLLSATISNVTAPVLLLTVVQPLLHDGPTDSRFARALLLGLAFSCNLGGMLTPIASPQNAIALVSLQHVAGADVSFGMWLSVAAPVALLGTIGCWLLLLLLGNPDDVKTLPTVEYSEEPLTSAKVASLAAVGSAVLLWASLSLPPLRDTLGDPAVVGILLSAVAFGSGFLTKDDFNALPWHLLALIAGGNALGLSVHESGLLEDLVDVLFSVLHSKSTFLLTAELVACILLVGVFVSHTVAAIIIMPLVASVGLQVGEPVPIVFCAALACSAAMALPVSSFPNLNSLSAEDDLGGGYLSAADFLKVGVPATLLAGLLVITVGHALAEYFLSDLSQSSPLV